MEKQLALTLFLFKKQNCQHLFWFVLNHSQLPQMLVFISH